MKILDGKQLSKDIQAELADEVQTLVANGSRAPHLAAILVGGDGASEAYVRHKVKACERVGFNSTLLRFEDSITEKQLIEAIENLNQDDEVDGFIVQLPLPDHINVENVTVAIKPSKDVDGFHPINIGRMAQNMPAYISATPFGILELLKRNYISTSGKQCVILGRSNIVGRPMSILMSRNDDPGNCTVTLCHSRTSDLKEQCLRADILIVALGKPEFVTAEMVMEGAVVIDVGITRVEDETAKRGYRLKGDVKFDEVAPKCSYITPVPGGVGPMTVASLLMNTLKAALKEIYQ